MSTKTLERAITTALRGAAAVSYVDGVVESVTPYRVLCTGEDDPVEVEPLVERGATGRRVAVFAVGAHRFALPFALEA